MIDLKAILPEVKQIALDAGALELEHYHAGTDVNRKQDGSPVTVADQEAEILILSRIQDMGLGIPVVAEESVAAGHVPDISKGTFWLVDPLDGTKEFVRGSGEFTVNIALMIDFKPVFGVIYAPVIDELYSGHLEGPADMTVAGKRREISVRPVPEDGLTVVTSRSHNDMAALKVFLKGHKVAKTSFRGSSLKICQVASGMADIYPRLAPTCEWDIAAGHAIVNAAGGTITRMNGEDMRYGKVEDNFLNPHFLVRAA